MIRIGFLLRVTFILVLGIVLSTNLLLASLNKIEIKAKNIEVVNSIVTASNDVIVNYDTMVIKATAAKFNKKTKILTLDGNIETIGYNGTKEHSNHMVIDTNTNEVTFEELFLLSENDVWIISKNVNKKDKIYKFNTSVISSCDVSNPLWTMRFSDSIYDVNKSYMKVYNAKLYMWDIPIFYTPYLGFSINKKRSSGLLFPLFGYTSEEGFIYEQPIFWAIAPNIDIEVNPQLRSERSSGVYTTLRFVDSNHSEGTLRLGYFEDFESFTTKYNVPNSKHYGYEFNYYSTEIFAKNLTHNFKDGLYVNTTYLNDIDYLRLQKNNLSHFGLTPLQESRINYFAENNEYYFGLNAKYFIDTRINVDDDKTLQILPAIQFHKYLEHVISKNFTYSLDFKMNNFDRKKGSIMKQAEFNVPIEFTTSFFDDFISISLREELYYSKFFFGNGDFVSDDYQYYSNIYKAKIFTDLTKDYGNIVHVLQPSILYVKPGVEDSSPIEFSQLDNEQKELFTVGVPKEQIKFALSQYFYDDNMKLKFFQRIAQTYYADKTYKFSDINNEMQYSFDSLVLYNNLGYSQEFKRIRFSSSYLAYKKSDYRFTIGHSYKVALADEPKNRDANDINFNFKYNYNKQFSFNGGLTYNIDNSTSKQWKIGGSYYRDCWSMVASIRQDIYPTSIGSISQNTFYVQLNFTPFGSIGTDTLR